MIEAVEAVVTRKRQRYSAEFKNQVIKACQQPGVSVAAMALHYRLNANLLRTWIKAHERSLTGSSGLMPPESIGEFVAIPCPPGPTSTNNADIVIEIRRDAMSVNVRWPSSAAAECAQWLQRCLK